MSRAPVFRNWQGCSFEGIDLSLYVTEWSDTREYALAQHQYLKRPGAENEPMGREPHVCRVVLSFTGPSWYKDFLALVAALDKNPKGVLVHPLFGAMRAACQGYREAKMNLEQAADLYVVPLVFVEDAIDTSIDAPQSQGVSAQQQQIAAYTNSLQLKSQKYSTAITSITSYVTQALAYASAAAAAALNATPDFTLAGKLSALRDAAMAARDAVRADPAETQDAPRYVAIALIEQTLDACRQLDATIRAFKPTVFLYTVPARVHLAKLAHQFYGKDGLARITEIQTNNPGQLTDPHAIAPGTQLWMALPTV